jgi:hypothetical protein
MKIRACWQMGWILMVQRDRLLVALDCVLIRRSSAKNMILMLMITAMSPNFTAGSPHAERPCSQNSA